MQKKSGIKKFMASKSFLLIVLTLIVLAITYLKSPGAFNVGNARQLLSNMSYTGVFVCGVSLLLISGGIDFSTAGQATVGMIIFAKLLEVNPSLPWPVALLVALIFGAISGGINAFFANGLNLMPFICTIGMSSVWTGLASWYTRGNIISIRVQSFVGLATKTVGKLPIPWMFVFMALLIVIYSFVLIKTRFGRSVMMVGGNPIAARLAGLNPKKIKSLLFINNGVLAVVGGLIWASQMKMASPAGLVTLAPEMTALSASILGGVSFSGGAGGISGAFFGIVLMQTLAYALQVMGLPLWVIQFINGSMLIIALTIEAVGHKIRAKRLGKASAGGGGGGPRMMMPGMSR